MATKSGQEQAASSENVEEMLDVIDKNLERIKTLYEQYFLGIQKQAPTFLHTDIERKLRDLTQLQVRNTGLRYRLATLQQKFGSYNSYWKRTLRQIENGTYLRNLSKIGREAVRTGAEIPEEILAAMPKRMREQVIRDRDQAIAIAKRQRRHDDTNSEQLLELAEPQPPEVDDVAAMISEPSFVKKELKTRGGAHIIADDDFDLDKFFNEVEQENTETGPPPTKPARASTDVSASAPPPAAAPAPVKPPVSVPVPVIAPRLAPSQASRPNPIAPGSAAARGDVPVESMQGPFPRAPVPDARQTGPVPVVPRPTGQIPAIPPVRPTGQIPVIPPVQRPTEPNPTVPAQRATGTSPTVPQRPTGPVPTIPMQRPTGPMPPLDRATGPIPTIDRPTGPMPAVRQTGPVPTIPAQRPAPVPASTQTQPGAAPRPAPRAQTPAPVPQKPPLGMSDADVNALYQKYAQAKQLVGEQAGARDREKLLKTINAQAPKIMEQYKAKGVEFSVVVKDNQVIIRAKPKT